MRAALDDKWQDALKLSSHIGSMESDAMGVMKNLVQDG